MEMERQVLDVPEPAQNEVAASRANVYFILARCFRPPEDGLAQDLDILEQMLGRLYPQCLPDAGTLRKTFRVADQQTLKVQHAKLFVGPYDLLAPPYGSVYLDGERRVMGESTMDVAALYTSAGLSANPENHEPPDHISSALEFMYFLNFQQATGEGDEQPELAASQRQVLLDHLGIWVAPFTGRILASGLGGFYAALADVTAEFIALEMDRLAPAPPLAVDGRQTLELE